MANSADWNYHFCAVQLSCLVSTINSSQCPTNSAQKIHQALDAAILSGLPPSLPSLMACKGCWPTRAALRDVARFPSTCSQENETNILPRSKPQAQGKVPQVCRGSVCRLWLWNCLPDPISFSIRAPKMEGAFPLRAN